MNALIALKEALDAIPHREQARVSKTALLKELGDLPDDVATRLQQVSGDTLNLVAALAATHRGNEVKLPFSSAWPQFPAEHEQNIEALCAQILATPADLENRVVAMLQTMRDELPSELAALRRYERAQRLLSNLVRKSVEPTHNLFEGVR